MSQVRIFSAGEWRQPQTERSSEIYNPSLGSVTGQVPLCSAAQTGEVVHAAANALPDWANTPVVERARIMFRFHSLLDERLDELAELVTREHGKTLAESQAEMKRGLARRRFRPSSWTCCYDPY